MSDGQDATGAADLGSDADPDAESDAPEGFGRRRFARVVGVGGAALVAGALIDPHPAGATATGSWSLTGNKSTTPGPNFLGTTDTQPLVFRTANLERARFSKAGQLGVGLTSPTAQIHAHSTNAHGSEGDTTAPNCAGVFGRNLATNAAARGVQGTVPDAGFGVRGDAGIGYGVYGNALAGVGVGGTSDNIGVRGNGTNVGVDAVTGSGGIGVRAAADGGGGSAVSAAGTSGASGVAATSDTGFGVLGSATAAGGIGVYGESAGGTGVRGNTTSGSGVVGSAGPGATGVSGSTSGSSSASKGVSGTVPDLGYGVHGTTGSGFGVYGNATKAAGAGVGGVGAVGGIGVVGSVPTTGYGVRGLSGGAGIGIYGACTDKANGLAGQFDGGVTVNGSETVNGDLNVFSGGLLSVPSSTASFIANLACDTFNANDKHFRIDHPQDPANKFLVHSCVESDERLNLYSGAVTLDASGTATVQLPAYFHALNVDARVQLTAVGRGYVFVERDVQDGRFAIGGEPGQKVYWQVSGIRNDAYAAANPMQVEVAKAAHERGYYVTPAAHGHGPDRAIHTRRAPDAA